MNTYLCTTQRTFVLIYQTNKFIMSTALALLETFKFERLNFTQAVDLPRPSFFSQIQDWLHKLNILIFQKRKQYVERIINQAKYPTESNKVQNLSIYSISIFQCSSSRKENTYRAYNQSKCAIDT